MQGIQELNKQTTIPVRGFEPLTVHTNPETEKTVLFSHMFHMTEALKTGLDAQGQRVARANSISIPADTKPRIRLKPLSEVEMTKISSLKQEKNVEKVNALKMANFQAHPNWPINYHNIESYSFWNDTIQLEDGSHWKVDNIFKVMNWRKNDVLIIRPNYSCFTGYRFYIENQRTGSTVQADLSSIGPDYFGKNSHWISEIDYFSGIVYLENGSCWQVAEEDLYMLNFWQRGDHIVIADSDEFVLDSLIINYNRNEFAYALEY